MIKVARKASEGSEDVAFARGELVERVVRDTASPEELADHDGVEDRAAAPGGPRTRRSIRR